MENIVRKGEIACNKQLLLFSQCFLSYMVLFFHFKCTLECCLQICFNLDQSKIFLSGNGLKELQESMDRYTGSCDIPVTQNNQSY